jgi:hypothetical protein
MLGFPFFSGSDDCLLFPSTLMFSDLASLGNSESNLDWLDFLSSLDKSYTGAGDSILTTLVEDALFSPMQASFDPICMTHSDYSLELTDGDSLCTYNEVLDSNRHYKSPCSQSLNNLWATVVVDAVLTAHQHRWKEQWGAVADKAACMVHQCQWKKM